MTLAGFVVRSATAAWWRSLTLAAFISAIAFLMVVFASFSAAVRDKVDNVVVRGLTGHIQFHSDKNAEQDMVTLYDPGWDDIDVLPAAAASVVRKNIAAIVPHARLEARVRRSVSLMHGTKREQSLLIGLDPTVGPDPESFILATGHALSAGKREMLLTQEQAKNLKAAVGDTLQVVTRGAQGSTSELDFTVCGIGDFVMLSLFSYKACFVDIAGARELVGLGPQDVTDLLAFLHDPAAAPAVSRRLAEVLRENGAPAVTMSDTKLSTEAMSSDEGKLPGQKAPVKTRISTWQDMGKTFRGVGDAISLSLTALVVFLMLIVSILIVNLVSLMGIERYREIGTLRAMGYSRGRVTGLFMAEIMAVCLSAALAGALLGVALVAVLTGTGVSSPVPALDFVMGKVLYPRLNPADVALILCIICVFSLGASLAPALRACSLRPADTLRQE